MKEILHPYPCVVNELTWEPTVIHGDYPQCKLAKHCKAIWDTGASDTTMDTRAVKLLGLKRVEGRGPKDVHTANGIFKSYPYHACIQLAPEWPPMRIIIWEMPPSDMEVLIGMDIISHGLFQIWPQEGRTMLRFVMQ